MNMTLVLNKARKDFERAKTQAAADARAAQLARQLARAAKIRLKQARKLSRMAKKSARQAEAKSEESSQALEIVQAKLEKLHKRFKKDQRRNKPARRVRTLKLVGKSKLATGLTRSTRGLEPKPINGAPANPEAAVALEPKPVPGAVKKLDALQPLPAPDVDTPFSPGEEPTN